MDSWANLLRSMIVESSCRKRFPAGAFYVNKTFRIIGSGLLNASDKMPGTTSGLFPGELIVRY